MDHEARSGAQTERWYVIRWHRFKSSLAQARAIAARSSLEKVQALMEANFHLEAADYIEDGRHYGNRRDKGQEDGDR